MTQNQSLIAALIVDADNEELAIKAEREHSFRSIAAREKELENMRTAIRVLEQRERASISRPITDQQIQQLEQDSVPPKAKKSFTATVKEVIDKLETDRVTNAEIYGQLHVLNADMPRNPRIQIGTILGRLQKNGTLVKASTAGGKPDGYRKTTK